MPESNFIDHVRVFCRSGSGGKGSSHFRREKHVPQGGPDGGDGGKGGDVIVRANPQLWTLLHLRYTKHIKAEDGASGTGQLKTGASGNDAIIEVPLGTVALDAETNDVLFEITEPNQEVILLPGGRGGLGNYHFRNAQNQSPTYAQPGESAQEGWFVLELKVLADVGLVGLPNAGKSTLLSVVSAAKPKIADYAFTTLTPQVGVVSVGEYQSFVMADIPGIIEGAAEGKGLGLRFLRHIERNSVLLFCVASDSGSIMADYNTLVAELKKYNPELLEKRRLLAITKSDLLDDGLMEMLAAEIPKKIDYIFISSFTQKNIAKLKSKLFSMMQKN